MRKHIYAHSDEITPSNSNDVSIEDVYLSEEMSIDEGNQSNERPTEPRPIIITKQTVINDLSNDLLDFYGYVHDIIGIPKVSSLEITARAGAIVSKFANNIIDAHESEINGQNDAGYLRSMPKMTFDDKIFDEYIRHKYDFKPPEKRSCSNGDTFHYIPIGNYILSRFQKEEEAFEKNVVFFESMYFLDHIRPFIKDDDKVVHIQLYADEFEVCNPIGPAKSKHKLFAMYFRVINFHPQHTSHLNSFHVIFLVKASTVRSVGIHEVFSPLIEELQELYYDGVDVNNVKHYVIADFLSGDNLASNFVGGFSCSFSQGQFCRFCTISTPEVCSSLTSIQFQERTHATIESDSIERCGFFVAFF